MPLVETITYLAGSERKLRKIVRKNPWFIAGRAVLNCDNFTDDPYLNLHFRFHPLPSHLTKTVGLDDFQLTDEIATIDQGSESNRKQYEIENALKNIVNVQDIGDTEPTGLEDISSTEKHDNRNILSQTASHKTAEIEDPGRIPEQKSNQTDIIDSFLSKNIGKITPGENITDEDASVNSSSLALEDEDITEELAEIYLSQGLTGPAKEIYRKLSLLIPEKSVYFAEILQKIDREVG